MAERIARINGKYYDLGTANKSFIQVAKDLKSLGIKNCLFMLEIKDPSLIAINPFSIDPKTEKCNLTKDQISRIMTECFRNPWYYLREICRIKDPGGTSVPYLANRGNIAQAWCVWKGIDSWLCLPRQKGKTQSALAMLTWCYLFGTSNSEFIFTNKDGEGAKTNLLRLSDQIDLLPEYLRQQSIVDDETGSRQKAQKNATKIRNPVNGNSIIVKLSATSYEKALSLARGLTAPMLYFDEPEFTKYIKTIVANSVSTFEQAAKAAKRNHAMYARIFTCTPGDLSTKEGMESQLLLDNTMKWSETMYNKTPEEIQDFIDQQGESCNQIFYIEYNYKQIGETDEWFKKLSAKIGDKITVRRELLLQRLHGSSASPFSQEDIEYIVSRQRKAIDELWIRDYYRFDIYEKLDKTIPYIVGIDCATGTNGDNNAITIIDPYTVEPVAEFECSYIGERKFIEVIKDLVSYHIPKAVLCIERNHVGDAIIDFLLASPIRRNLYFDKAKDLEDMKMRSNESVVSMLKKQAEQKTYYGVYTEGNSREVMMSILARHVNEFKEKFVTEHVTRDLTRLVRLASGKIVAAIAVDETGEPFHDDAIMSYLIGLYVFYHGNNLAVFGVYPGEMKDNVEKNKGMQRSLDTADENLIDRGLLESLKKTEEENKKLEAALNFEDMMRAAALQAQKDTFKLHEKGLVNDSILSDSPDFIIDNLDDEGSVSMDLFSKLNGF